MSSFMRSSHDPDSTVDHEANGTTSRIDQEAHYSHLSSSQPSTITATSADARFSCSICTDAVIEPVVTYCGHLYCWSCLYRWLEAGMTLQERYELFGGTYGNTSSSYYDPSKRVCPVCRAPCSVKRVIPIYVRTDSTTVTTASTTTTPNYVVNQATSSPSQAPSTTTNTDNDDILNTIETVMDEDDNENNPDIVVLNDNEEVDEVEMFGMEEEEGFSSVNRNRTSTLHTMGLRNRARIRSSISEATSSTIVAETTAAAAAEQQNRTTTTTTSVPRRPIARSTSNLRMEDNADVAAAAANNRFPSSRTSPTTNTSTNPQQQHHPASLAHGMLPLVQQAIRHAAMVAGTTTATTNQGGISNNDAIPPIHRLEGMRNNNNLHPNSSSTTSNNNALFNPYGISMMDQQPSDPTPDFLSWILLLLGIFVLACLILF